jgi:hypothetical protein
VTGGTSDGRQDGLGDAALIRPEFTKMANRGMAVRRPIRFTTAVFVLILSVMDCAAPAWPAKVVDHLSVPGPVDFNSASYLLSWSSHPSAYYYKQEYLPAGETSEHFRHMVLIEAVVQGPNVDGAVSAQVNTLNRRKSTDPMVNFAIIKEPRSGEVILDFILSSEDKKGEAIVEWNAYRYLPLKDQDGKPGVLLFGLSRRAYGDDTESFLRRLRSARPAEINALVNYKLPAVRPGN